MARLALLVLFVVHAFYAFKRLVTLLVPRRKPKPLLARRRRVPAHLAVVLVPDAENHDAREEELVMEECVEQMVQWCKDLGVERLSVYERDGVLSRKSHYASPVLSQKSLDLPSVALKPSRDLPTPPPSDTDSTSRPRSPASQPGPGLLSVSTFNVPYLSRNDVLEIDKKPHRRRRQSQIFESKPRRQTLTLDFLSRESSKPAMAAAARSLAFTQAHRKSRGSFHLTIESLDALLEGDTGFPCPDLVMVHHLYPSTAPLELHGFPPWQSRLSEIFYAPRRPSVLLRHIFRRDPSSTPLAVSEADFRKALDEYAGAEFRLGK